MRGEEAFRKSACHQRYDIGKLIELNKKTASAVFLLVTNKMHTRKAH